MDILFVNEGIQNCPINKPTRKNLVKNHHPSSLGGSAITNQDFTAALAASHSDVDPVWWARKHSNTCFTVASLRPVIFFDNTLCWAMKKILGYFSLGEGMMFIFSFYCWQPCWVTLNTHLAWSIHSFVSLFTNIFKLQKIGLENDEPYLHTNLTIGKD